MERTAGGGTIPDGSRSTAAPRPPPKAGRVTALADDSFAARVRTALDERIRLIVAEAAGHAWRNVEHRGLSERLKALVAAWCADGHPDGSELPGHAVRLADRLRTLQNPSGLFRGGDNVDSPPDSAFSVNDLADAALLLRGVAGGTAERLGAGLADLLTAATPGLAGGGVHTPNHRWELAAALARLHRLRPQPALAARVEQWLAEGVDLADGLYSERSAGYAAHVSNPSLLTIAEVFDRPDLLDAVEQNLTATLDLLLPDGTVETVLSRRQDQRWPVPLAAYLLPLRRVALLRGRGDLAWAAGLALAQGVSSPGDAAACLLLDPGIGRPLPPPVPPYRPRQRVFGRAGLLVEHRSEVTTVVFGGSDYARHGRIRSGLANSPTFLRLFAGAAVLDSVRLSRAFFGVGPFRGDGLVVASDPPGTTTVHLAETVTAAYYQPLAPADRIAGGGYGLGDEGRFSAAMAFDRRTRDEVSLTTRVRVRLTASGAEVTVDIGGGFVDWALELAFRPGGTMTGARPLGDGSRWQLDADAPGPGGGRSACYRVGQDSLSVTVVEASDGHGGPLVSPAEEPAYHPGEEYQFLGGTDAVPGELLYLAGTAPARLTIDISAAGRAHPGGGAAP